MINNTFGNTKVLFLAVVGAVIIGAVFLVLLFNVTDETREEFENENPAPEEETEAVVWETYENEMYNFSIQHPRDWNVEVSEDEPGSPKINLYPPDTDTSSLPFTHHSEAVTHVSVFPHGIPTEGFFGEAAESSVDLLVPVERASDFVLADGTPFATMAFLNTNIEGWTQSGFLFAHVRVENEEITCMRGNTEVPADICDPLMGDTLVRNGSINGVYRDISVRMLESFTFTSE